MEKRTWAGLTGWRPGSPAIIRLPGAYFKKNQGRPAACFDY